MHNRYTSKQIENIWSDENKYQLWFDIEVAVCEAHEKLGNISKEAVEEIRKCRWMCVEHMNFVEKIDEIEKEVKHDVLAFLTYISSMVGSSAKYVHMGMTSQDLLDTCTAIQIRDSIKVICDDLHSLGQVLGKKAQEHKYTLCVGRTHGIHAEPTTFGLKLLGHYEAFKRCYDRLNRETTNVNFSGEDWSVSGDVCRIKCSGAVGTYAVIDPKIEEYLHTKFGISSETVSTQVVPRDRHALLMCLLGIIGGCIENLAIEIRHLQRTEVGEVHEEFTKGQKGSSAMPHKKNPILTENLTGLARLIKMAVAPALDNIALWHERDISHSSVERVILPDTFSYVSFALQRLSKVIEHMVVDKTKMTDNLTLTGGAVYSQQILLFLINKKGLTREDAYKLIQENAHNIEGTFKNNLIKNKVLTQNEYAEIYHNEYYTKHIDYIFKKVFK